MKTNSCSPQAPLPALRLRAAQRAFSLVETALALGIVAFAFVGLLGMLPAGLVTFRKAMDTTVSAQIVQRIVGDAEQTEFDTLISKATSSDANFYILPVRYFDDQGSEVASGGATPTAKELLRILYQVRVRGSQPGPADLSGGPANFTSLPATNAADRFHPRDSTFLTIQIANNPGNRTLKVDTAKQLWDAADASKFGVSITTQSAVVTRNGKAKKP